LVVSCSDCRMPCLDGGATADFAGSIATSEPNN
jgi:hypothetical protein